MSGCKSKMDSYADINGPGKSQREFCELVMLILTFYFYTSWISDDFSLFDFVFWVLGTLLGLNY